MMIRKYSGLKRMTLKLKIFIRAFCFLFFILQAPSLSAQTPEAKRIQPGDILQINVFGIPEEITKEAVINEDGTLIFPLAGSIHAAGLTYEELSAALKEKLLKYFVQPEVAVGDAESKPTFSITGKVVQTGTYPLTKNITLAEAVILAGGTMPDASLMVRVIRYNKEILMADLNKILKGTDLTQNISIKPGDVIYVIEKPAFKISVLGNVKNPGEYNLQPGWGITEAIISAGGLVTTAGATGGVGNIVYIQRQGFYQVTVRRAGKEIYAESMDPVTLEAISKDEAKFVFEEGDALFVREMRYSVVVLGAVKTPYVYEFKPGNTVVDALILAGGPVETISASATTTADLKNVGIVRVLPDGKSKLIQVNLEDVLRKGEAQKNIEIMDRDIIYVPYRHRKLKWDEIILKITNIKTIKDILTGW